MSAFISLPMPEPLLNFPHACTPDFPCLDPSLQHSSFPFQLKPLVSIDTLRSVSLLCNNAQPNQNLHDLLPPHTSKVSLPEHVVPLGPHPTTTPTGAKVRQLQRKLARQSYVIASLQRKLDTLKLAMQPLNPNAAPFISKHPSPNHMQLAPTCLTAPPAASPLVAPQTAPACPAVLDSVCMPTPAPALTKSPDLAPVCHSEVPIVCAEPEGEGPLGVRNSPTHLCRYAAPALLPMFFMFFIYCLWLGYAEGGQTAFPTHPSPATPTSSPAVPNNRPPSTTYDPGPVESGHRSKSHFPTTSLATAHPNSATLSNTASQPEGDWRLVFAAFGLICLTVCWALPPSNSHLKRPRCIHKRRSRTPHISPSPSNNPQCS